MVSWRGLGLLGLLLSVNFFSFSSAAHEQIHLVQLSPTRAGKDDPAYSHRGYLEAALGGNDSVDGCLIYCYYNVFDGFAAKLTPEQVSKLSQMQGVLSVVPNTFVKTQTTHSWRFLGVESPKNPETGALWERANYGQDVIIGVIDSGIWPESASFSDHGMGPVPARWKGECVDGDVFSKESCNRKLIGAKFFLDGNLGVSDSTWEFDYKSARDVDGHGTHVASTAAGNFAPADWNGLGNGTAKGGAPHARIAAYKVCWAGAMCSTADVAAGIEEALKDGVDLITISLDNGLDKPMFEDLLAISSYHAMRQGIFVSFSAGNTGPSAGRVVHGEPWSMAVAAGTTDRFLGSDVRIGLQGRAKPSIAMRGSIITQFPTITAPFAKFTNTSKFCLNNTLDPSEVQGKIVFCLRGDLSEDLQDKAEMVMDAGGVGMIAGNADKSMDYQLRFDLVYNFPALLVKAADASRIQAFLSSCDEGLCNSRDPVATIYSPKSYLGLKPSPMVADFSARGPNILTPSILKPDIMGPGVDILGAFYNQPYAFLSGTSMATPHIAGVAALIKALHPRWSPAAIKSAIMTSAKTVDNTKKPIQDWDGTTASAFATGSGMVNPPAALEPGLVYDASARDYNLFLCALGYSDQNVEVITGEKGFCSAEKYFPSLSNLNYPSLSVANLTMKATTITRRVTNVGRAKSLYTVSVQAPEGVKVSIYPSILRYSRAYETKTFTVKLERTKPADFSQETYAFGSYTWSDGYHKVRSPIVVGTQPS
ncbi:tRNA guanosine-2'-O-methyltransferase [Marchantia polymorpha subsp. ruderalis]